MKNRRLGPFARIVYYRTIMTSILKDIPIKERKIQFFNKRYNLYLRKIQIFLFWYIIYILHDSVEHYLANVHQNSAPTMLQRSRTVSDRTISLTNYGWTFFIFQADRSDRQKLLSFFPRDGHYYSPFKFAHGILRYMRVLLPKNNTCLSFSLHRPPCSVTTQKPSYFAMLNYWYFDRI